MSSIPWAPHLRWIARGPFTSATGMLSVRAVKAYHDGALGWRGAQLLADYSDRPGHRGLSGGADGFDRALVADAMSAGFQVGIHAIGDAGNRRTNWRTRDGRRRESARRASPALMRGARCARPAPHSASRRTNPAPTGTPFHGLHSAITRQDTSGAPAGGWYPAQRLTPEEAVRGCTVWSAAAGFDEGDAGTIRLGRRADRTVLDVDPFRAEGPALLRGAVLLTVSRGRVTFQR